MLWYFDTAFLRIILKWACGMRHAVCALTGALRGIFLFFSQFVVSFFIINATI